MTPENPDAASLLGDRVRKWSLPVFQGPPGPGIAGVKRLFLKQGELAQFYDGEEGIRYLAFVALKPQSLRGNHYHERKREWLYLISGELSLLLEDIGSRERTTLELQAGDLALVEPRIAHTLVPKLPGQAIEFSPIRFDPADIYPYSLA